MEAKPTKKPRLSSASDSPCSSSVEPASASRSRGGAKKKSKKSPRMTAKRMQELLRLLGVDDHNAVSKCLKAAILNGHVKLEDPKSDPEGVSGLDQVLLESSCPVCSKALTCRVRDVLYQPDYGGMDYEDGGESATFRCTGDGDEGCCGLYVTEMCSGSPSFDCGKFHNHCSLHPRYGYCIGDYREAHCESCGDHYFAGGMGNFPCSCETAAEEKMELLQLLLMLS